MSAAAARAVRPTWAEFWGDVGNEEWLCAKRILEADPHHILSNDAAQWLTWADDDETSPWMEWDAWIEDVETEGRGWSSTEHVAFRLVASLIDCEYKVNLRDLTWLGSWEGEVLSALVTWASGGNNRNLRGRLEVAR